MKSSGPNFGHEEMDYRLVAIFNESQKSFVEADQKAEQLDELYAKNKIQIDLIPQIFAASNKRIESGTMLLITSVAYLEQVLYAYATTFLHPDSYEAHLGKNALLSRWIIVPRICENIIIDEQDPAINQLRELIAARNAIVHPKRQIMYDPGISSDRVGKEQRRFFAACRKAEVTVKTVINLLSRKTED